MPPPLVDSFENWEGNSQYSPMGNNYGNPLFNLLMKSMLGNNYNPMPVNGQSMYDAHIERQRSMHFMDLQRSSMANNMLFQKIGFSNSSAANILGAASGSPEGMIAKMLSPLVGGNPMAASMQMYAGLSGAGVMGNFGRYDSITAGETMQSMEELANNFYTKKSYGGPGGAKENIENRFVEQIMERATTPDGLKDLKAAGIDKALDLSTLDKDSSGNLTDEGKASLKSRAEALKKQITDQESDIGRKIDEASRQNTMQANAGLDISKKFKEAMAANDNALKVAAEKKLQDYLEKEIKLDPTEINKLKDSSGKLDTSKIDAKFAQMKEPSFLNNIRDQNRQAAAAGGIYTGFDFEKTRGFKLEDITSGFTRAADLRMLGDRKKQTPAQAMADFSKHGMGAMSAARSVFGDKSGSELVGKISDLVGASAVDLGSEKGANEIEDLLRKTNATARVAGVSIKTMLAIIDSTRQLAANNPALQNMNAGASTEIALKAVSTAARMGAQMSAEDYRKAGGGQGLATKEIEAGTTFAASDMGRADIALLHTVKTLKPEAYNQVEGMLKRGEITAETLTNQGKLNQLAKTLGMDPSQLSTQVLQNPLVAQEGLKDKKISSTVSTDIMRATAVRSLDDQFKAKNIDLEKEYRRTGDMSKVKLKAFMAAGTEGELRNSLNVYGSQFFDEIAQRVNDPKGEKKSQFDALVKEQAEQEKAMSKRMDASQAGVKSQIFDAILKGNGLKDTAQKVAEVFAVTKPMATSQDPNVLKTTQEAQKATEESMALLTGPGGKKKTDDELAKQKSASGGSAVMEILNKQISAGREAAKVYGKNEDAAELKDLKIVGSAEDQGKAIQEALKTIKNTDYASAEEASEDLKKLREKERSGKPLEALEKERLQALNLLGSTVTNEKGFSVMKQGKFSLRSLMAASPAAHADRLAKYELEKSKEGLVQNAGEQLELIAKQTPITREGQTEQATLKETLNQYRDKKTGKVDYKKMYDEYQHKSGYFKSLSEDKMRSLNEGQFGTKMQGVTNLLEKEQDRIAAAGGPSAGDPSKAMGASMDSLKESIEKLNESVATGGAMASAITNLATQLATLLNGGGRAPLPQSP